MDNHLQEVTVEKFTAEREWTVEGIPVLKADISLPSLPEENSRAARRINRFYRLQARSYLRYCENWLFPRAAAEYQHALEVSAPLPCCTATLTDQITCCRGGILSLHTDSREQVSGRPETVRRGDTWDLSTGLPVALSDCFPQRDSGKQALLCLAAEEIARQEDAGIARYHDKWRQKLRRTFNRENFYLTEEGVAVFWQMYAIAPAAEGIPAFVLPYGKDNCRFPGSKA